MSRQTWSKMKIVNPPQVQGQPYFLDLSEGPCPVKSRKYFYKFQPQVGTEVPRDQRTERKLQCGQQQFPFSPWQILRQLKGYDSYNTLLLPPRAPGEKLPPELYEYFKEVKKSKEEQTKAQENGEHSPWRTLGPSHCLVCPF